MSQRPPVEPNPAPLAPPPATEAADFPAAFALLVDCAVCDALHSPGTDDDSGCDPADF